MPYTAQGIAARTLHQTDLNLESVEQKVKSGFCLIVSLVCGTVLLVTDTILIHSTPAAYQVALGTLRPLVESPWLDVDRKMGILKAVSF